jgi:hypothetical protein
MVENRSGLLKFCASRSLHWVAAAAMVLSVSACSKTKEAGGSIDELQSCMEEKNGIIRQLRSTDSASMSAGEDISRSATPSEMVFVQKTCCKPLKIATAQCKSMADEVHAQADDE